MFTWGVLLATFLLGGEASPLEKRVTYKTAARNGLFPLDVVDKLEVAAMPKVEAWMAKKPNKNNCTLENAGVRREWSDMAVPEREAYIKAVLCLQSKPSKSKAQAPGALSRYDDFVSTHMTQATMLHDPTHLFASHRYFIWLYEKALRDECGYTGHQPYMNYDRYAQDPVNSAIFNGNASSMSGQGLPAQYPGVPQGFRPPYNMIPWGGGGGCVTEGPFKDMVISLGPKGVVIKNIPKNPRADGLGTNPRCLRRDVNKNSALGATANYTYSLIMDNPKIDDFYNRYLGQPQLKGDNHPWGLHNAGHYIIGGDPGGDFYCSPGDPLFWFHHGMLDRVWWLWQMQDPENRVNLVPGMGAQGMNHPMLALMTREDQEYMQQRDQLQKRQGKAKSAKDVIVDLGWTGPPVSLDKLNDQLGGNDGQFCYVYV